MEHNLIMIAKAIAELFNQEWVNSIRRHIPQTCEELVQLLENR